MQQKTFNQIVQNIINNIHDTMPEIDTKTGTFIRDVIVNPVADEFSGLYSEMKLIELTQSVLTSTGDDLDKLAANYFITRKQSTNSYGKIRFYISNVDIDTLPEEILIPKGTIISTIPTIARPTIQVQTIDSFYGNKDKIKLLPIDANYPFFYFIELAAMSVLTGSQTNVGAGELVQQANNINPTISFVKNPFAFTGGVDYEDDASLALRINLAISGANIGTKNGYLSYILKQNGVSDARVVGAGDYMMRRDGGHLDSQGEYVLGDGGMVDIYIRGEQKDEEIYEFPISSYYVDPINPDAFADIELPIKPVINITDISIVDPSNPINPVYLINAADFEVEKREATDGKKYYRDILWDFSITDTFQDEVYLYYLTSIPSNMPTKTEVDKELNEWLTLMSNFNYGLNWTYMLPEDGMAKDYFTPYLYTDNRIYMVKSSILNGLICVKRNDRIYMRVYENPDFELVKDDILLKGNSVQAKDSIHWIKKDSWKLGGDSKLFSGHTLQIRYNVNELIKSLQEGIEIKRVLTADVLVKQAQQLPIEVILNAYCFSAEDPEKIRTSIINKITTYIDTLKKLGGEFDLSDIISVAKQVDGVDSVELDGDMKPEIRIIPNSAKSKITANDNQYFKVQNIVVNVWKSNAIK